MLGAVERYLLDVIERDGAAHLTLIDPESQPPEKAGRIAESAARAGTDAFMVGGSINAAGGLLDETVHAIRRATSLPVILFPAGVHSLTPHADALFFMSMLNSRDLTYIIGNQMLGAPLVVGYGIEAIPMAYLVVEPGGTVGYVGDARPIPRAKPEIAVAYALAAQLMGMRFVYLEAGSGVSSPVPPEMISAVREASGCTLVVGGGIRDPSTAESMVRAGAHAIVTGNLVEMREDVEDVETTLAELIAAMKS